MDQVPLTKAWIVPAALERLLAAYVAVRTGEPCGLLLGGAEDDVVRVAEVPEVVNVHRMPEQAYAIAPADHVRIAQEARDRGLAVVGFWHGHTHGPASPGRADMRGLADAEKVAGRRRVLIIIGKGAGRRPVVRAWARGRRGLREIPLGT